MKYFITLLYMISFVSINADWNPDYSLMDDDVSVLGTKDYLDFRQTVCSSLENTWCSAEKAQLLMDLTMVTKPKVCVEIGAFVGSSILPVAATLNKLKQGKVYAVDAWSNVIACRYLEDNDPNKAWWSTVDMPAVHGMFDQLMNQWQLNAICVTLQEPSEEAVVMLDEIDFLHFDGDYSLKGSMDDVMMYVPKVKSGGYILFSNLYTTVNSKHPKLKAFCKLFESCEMICSIERDNAVLFKKY